MTHSAEEQRMGEPKGEDTRGQDRASMKHSTGAVGRVRRVEGRIVARPAGAVNWLTAQAVAGLRWVVGCWACAVVSAAVMGCHAPATAVPLQDPAATGLEVGLVVAAEVLAEEGYVIKPNLAKGKARVETGWRAQPAQRRAVTVTLRDSPQGLIVATRLLTAVPVAQGQQAPPETQIAFEGQPWQLVRPPTADDSAEQLRLAQRIQARWKERMRALPPAGR